MIQVSPYELIRLMDLLQEAGLLDNLPDKPADKVDFSVGSDTYTIKQCLCGRTTCLVWNALSITNNIEDSEQLPNLLITLAIRAHAQGYRHRSDYIRTALDHHGILAHTLMGTHPQDWVNICRPYDPLAVGLAMDLISAVGFSPGSESPTNFDDLVWSHKPNATHFTQ